MLSVKSLVRSTCAVGGAVVLLASGASAAVAAPAVFSATGTAKVELPTANPLSMSWGPAPWQNRTCVRPQNGDYGAAGISNTAGQGSFTLYFQRGNLTCTDGVGRSYVTSISASGPALASVNAGVYSLVSPRLEVRDNFGPGFYPATTPVSFTVPYTNGTTGITGANPSTITFSNTLVGYVTETMYSNGITTFPLRLSGALRTGVGPSTPLTLS